MKVSPTTGALMPVAGFSRLARPSAVQAAMIPPGAGLWRSHDGVLVVSTLDMTQLPGAPEGMTGLTWLVSCSTRGGRSTLGEMQRVIEAFEMPAWDEDNHYPGISRALFCPIEPKWRDACECKMTEQLVVDGDYQWTTDPAHGCRGCDHERMVATLTGRSAPCPLHQSSNSPCSASVHSTNPIDG